MNYYRRYMADYLSKTANLSLAEHGAYCLLLDYSYLGDGRLPGDQEEIFRMVRAVTSQERQAVTKVLSRFFVLSGDAYENQRVISEVEKARPAIEAARTNGVKGGRPKNNPMGSSEDNPPGSETEPKAKASQPLTPNHQPPTTNRQKTAGRGSRLPADWKPNPEEVEFCKAERKDLDPIATGERFRDFWIAQPGSKGVKLDWTATWRNWVRKENHTNRAQFGAAPDYSEVFAKYAEEPNAQA